MRETLDEARHHLSLPIPLLSENKPAKRSKAPTGTRQAARRLWAASKPVADSPVAAYLASRQIIRSEEHTSELQSLMRISYAVFCLKKKQHKNNYKYTEQNN